MCRIMHSMCMSMWWTWPCPQDPGVQIPGQVLFLVVIQEISNSCYGQLDAPKLYRVRREVGITQVESLVFLGPPKQHLYSF